MLTNNEIRDFFEFVALRERGIDLECPNVEIWFKEAYNQTELYVKYLSSYLDRPTFLRLVYNLWLHEYIVSGFDQTIYSKFDVDSKAMIINSASNSGSSTSIQSFRSLDEGRFMLMDLWRTPYGRIAYSILESLQGVPFVVL